MAHRTMPVSLLAFAVLWAARASAQNPDVLQDSDFTATSWVSKKLSNSTGTGTFTAVTESSGGNPGSYRRVTYIAQGGSLMVTHMDSSLAYSPAQQGPIRLITY